MYILKDQSRTDLVKEITDSQYEDLIFYKKWKYKYSPKQPVLTSLSTTPNRPNSATHSTFKTKPIQTHTYGNTQHHDTYNSNNNNSGFSVIDAILAGEVIENLIDNSQQQNQVYQYDDQPTQPVFSGGDTEGGGAQGSWGDTNQDTNTNDTNDLSDNFS